MRSSSNVRWAVHFTCWLSWADSLNLYLRWFAWLYTAVAERERPEDTWITDADSPHAAGALAYLTGCATALQQAGRGAMGLVTLGRREYREPLLTKAGLSVLSYEQLEPKKSMRRGEHNDVKLVIAQPACKG